MTPMLYAFPADDDATLDAVLDSIPDAVRHELVPAVTTTPDEAKRFGCSLVSVEAFNLTAAAAFAQAADGRATRVS